jgi:hypothetical protein
MNVKMVAAAVSLFAAACSAGALTVGTDNGTGKGSSSGGATGDAGNSTGDAGIGTSTAEAGTLHSDEGCSIEGILFSSDPLSCGLYVDFLNRCTADAVCARATAMGLQCKACVQTVDAQGTPVRWLDSVGGDSASSCVSCFAPIVLPPGADVTCLIPYDTGMTLVHANAICARTPDCKVCLHYKGNPNDPATWQWYAQQNASVCPCPS